MVEYKCVLKKVDAPAKKERKARSDKGGHHKKGESAVAKKKAPVSVPKKKKIKFNVVPKGTFEKRQKAKESAEATQEFLKNVAKAKAKAKAKAPAKKKKIKFNVKGACERDCQRARERNLGSGKQTSLDMLKRY